MPVEVVAHGRIKDRSAHRYMQALGKELRTGDVAPVLKKWRPRVIKSIQKDFDRGGQPRWKRNRPSTVASKGHSRVLFGRGGRSRIRDTITVVVRRGSWRRASLGIYDRTRYGIFHREGRRGPWKIPRSSDHPPYSFRIGSKWVTIARGKQIRHPGYPKRNYIVMHRPVVAELRELSWQRLRTLRHSKK